MLKNIIDTIEHQTSIGEEVVIKLTKNEGETLKYILKSFLANSKHGNITNNEYNKWDYIDGMWLIVDRVELEPHTHILNHPKYRYRIYDVCMRPCNKFNFETDWYFTLGNI